MNLGEDTVQTVAMHNFSTIFIKTYRPCYDVDILVHDSKVEK